MSMHIFRVNRSLFSSVSVIKYNCSRHVLLRKLRTGKEQFSASQGNCIFCINIVGGRSYLQPECRSINIRSYILQGNLQKSNTLNEAVLKPSEPTYRTGVPRRQFIENESEFYHKALGNSSAYSGTIYKNDSQFFETYKLSEVECKSLIDRPTNHWLDKSPEDIFKSFTSLGVGASVYQNAHIESRQIDSLITALVENLDSATEQQLIDCFIALECWPKTFKDPNFIKVWKELDEVCLKRYLDWSIDKCLFIMDLWYHLRLTRHSFFVTKGLTKISRKVDDFTAAQMVQALFHISCKRNTTGIAIREYEHYIQRYITKLSIEEIGIFVAAFFKTKTPILNEKLILYVMQRTVEEVETIESIVLASIAKGVRFSLKPSFGLSANDMVNKVLERRWDSFSLTTIIHLVHINTQIQFFSEDALTKLAEKFCKNPSEARMKDMERIAFFLSLYNFIPPSTPDILHLIVEQLNLPLREQEASDHPLFFLSLLYFLSLLKVHPEKQIRQAVDEEYLVRQFDKYIIPQQAVQLDYNRALEGPAGSEHLLSPSLREYLCRRYSLFFPDGKYRAKSDFDRLMSEVMELTDKLLGQGNYLVTYTLPHFPRADIVFRLDDSGSPLPIPEGMKAASYYDSVHRPVGPGKWYCVMMCGRNMYMHNVPRLVGEQATKLRQLQALGYTTITIPSYYWNKEQDKMTYMKLKYFSDFRENK